MPIQQIEELKQMMHQWIDTSRDMNSTLSAIRERLGSRSDKFNTLLAASLGNKTIRDAAKFAVTAILK